MAKNKRSKDRDNEIQAISEPAVSRSRNKRNEKMNEHVRLAKEEAVDVLLRAAKLEIERNQVPAVKHSRNSMDAFRQFCSFTGMFFETLKRKMSTHTQVDTRKVDQDARLTERLSLTAKNMGKAFLHWIGYVFQELFTLIGLVLITAGVFLKNLVILIAGLLMHFLNFVSEVLVKFWKGASRKWNEFHRNFRLARAEWQQEREENKVRRQEEAAYRKARKAEEEAFQKAKKKEEEAIRLAKKREEESSRETQRIESELAALALRRKQEEERVQLEVKRKEEAQAALEAARIEVEKQQAVLKEKHKLEEVAKIEAMKKADEASERLRQMVEEEAERERIEQERIAEEERKLREEEERIESERQKHEAKRKRLEEERLAEAERIRREAEERAEAERIRVEEEQKRLEAIRVEEVEKIRREEQERAEAERIRREEEDRHLAEVRRTEQERLRKEAEEEAEKRRLAIEEETERLRREAEAEAERQRLEVERLRQEAEAEVERQKLEAERIRKEAEEETERKRLEAERIRKEAEEEAIRLKLEAEEEEKRKQLEEQQRREEDAKRLAEEAERRRLEAEAEEKRKQLEEQQKREEEAKRLAEEAERKRLEEEERLLVAKAQMLLKKSEESVRRESEIYLKESVPQPSRIQNMDDVQRADTERAGKTAAAAVSGAAAGVASADALTAAKPVKKAAELSSIPSVHEKPADAAHHREKPLQKTTLQKTALHNPRNARSPKPVRTAVAKSVSNPVKSVPVHMPSLPAADDLRAKELITEARDSTNSIIYRIIKSLELKQAGLTLESALKAGAAKYVSIGLAMTICAFIGTRSQPNAPGIGTFILLFAVVTICGALLAFGSSMLCGTLMARKTGREDNTEVLRENSVYSIISAGSYILCAAVMIFSREKFAAVLIAVGLLSVIGHIWVLYRKEGVSRHYCELIYLLCMVLTVALIVILCTIFKGTIAELWAALK